MSAAHPGFERAERVLDGPPTDGHRLGQAIEPGLHLVEDAFVQPALDPLVLVGCASGIEDASLAGRQIAVVIHIIATIRADLALGQMLAGWTGVVIMLDIVDEVSAREEAAVWVVRGLRLWDDGEDAGCLAGKHLVSVEIAAIRQHGQFIATRRFLPCVPSTSAVSDRCRYW